MQALIPLLAILGLASATHLNLLPYAYLASPLPVYHHSQDTRTGEHAYSYAGGPSAKEEVKEADGVTRGSYSYVDANGILQSVFYVADENGFRVAATNLPTDDDLPLLEPAQVLLAKNAHSLEYGKSSRRKRSLEEDSDRNSNRNEHPEKPSGEKPSDQNPSETVQSLIYQLPDSLLVPKLLPAATSHQSQVQIHKNVQLESSKPEELAIVKAEPLYHSVILPEIPAATSHQSQVQIHKNLRVEVPEDVAVVKDKPIDVVHAPLTPFVPIPTIKAYQVDTVLAAVPSYHENRIQLHRELGLEGPERQNAVKIKSEPSLAFVDTPVSTVPVVPRVFTEEVLPVVQPISKLGTATVTTSVSSHGISQIHGPSKVDARVLTEPTLLVKSSPIAHLQAIPHLQQFAGVPLLHALPYATASHYRTQIHAK